MIRIILALEHSRWLCCSPLLHSHPAQIYNRFPNGTNCSTSPHTSTGVRMWRGAARCSGCQGSRAAGRGWSEISVGFTAVVSSGPTDSRWPCDLWYGIRGAHQNTSAHKRACTRLSLASHVLAVGLNLKSNQGGFGLNRYSTCWAKTADHLSGSLVWLRKNVTFVAANRLLWLIYNGMKWCRKWARWGGVKPENACAYRLS